MKGRPIGFDIRTGWADFIDWAMMGDPEDPSTTWIEHPQPLALRIIYNGCNCPASIFTGDLPPADMGPIVAVSGPTTEVS